MNIIYLQKIKFDFMVMLYKNIAWRASTSSIFFYI